MKTASIVENIRKGRAFEPVEVVKKVSGSEGVEEIPAADTAVTDTLNMVEGERGVRRRIPESVFMRLELRVPGFSCEYTLLFSSDDSRNKLENT